MITSIEGLALAQYRRNLPLFAAGSDRLRDLERSRHVGEDEVAGDTFVRSCFPETYHAIDLVR
jgi:hypothetical protein